MTPEELLTEVTDHRMEPWALVGLDGRPHLFGRVGPEWMLSSRVVNMDEGRVFAVTVTETMYALGKEVAVEDLPPEILEALDLAKRIAMSVRKAASATGLT